MYSTYAEDAEQTPSTEDAIRQCFSSIQSRKLWAPSCPNTCRLCPSMDLVIFGVQAAQTAAANISSDPSAGANADARMIPAANSLWIHRTVSWQRLATLTFEKPDGITRVTWSPDGRNLALASLDHRVLLYDVESLSNQTGSAYGGGAGGEATPDHVINIEPGRHGSYHREQSKRILGLAWAHVGRPHPTAWRQSENQVADEISWSYRSRYLDRSSVFLPPSEYNSDSLEADGIITTGVNPSKGSLPTCKTPLSLLCVSMEHSIELYLHGRYHIMSLPRKGDFDDNNAVDVVCSYDLTQLVVHERGSTRLSMYSLPALHHNRYHLQTIASLHTSITSHLNALQQSIPEAANSWKSSMKPLNAKLQPLQRLLSNYGVDESESAVLRQYILIGHTSASSNMANAMDQFFTGVQMNDQLLQRMERSLQGGLANVETMVRKGLVSPARSLVYHVGELAGQLRFQQTTNDTHDETAIISLQRASEMVLLSAETLLTQIIESRFRLRDFVAWLRSTGAQIKARGTANQSVQRENAKKRRVSDAILQRVLSYLDDTSSGDAAMLDDETKPKVENLTERLLGMKVSDLLKDNPRIVSTANDGRPSSPRSVQEKFALSKTTPTVVYAVEEAVKASEIVFAQPRNALSEFVLPEDFILPRLKSDSVVAIHSRLGMDAGVVNESLSESILEDEYDSDEGSKSFFCPIVASDGTNASSMGTSFNCRQWSVVCQAGQSDDTEVQKQNGHLQFFAIPLGWRNPSSFAGTDEDDDEDDEEQADTVAPFYLTTKLVLPRDCTVQSIGYYGDDGKSSLSSGTDSGTGKESRQKIGLIIRRQAKLRSSKIQSYQSEPLELWLVTYDNLQWQAVPSESILLEAKDIDMNCCANVKPITAADSDDMEDEENNDNNEDVLAQVRIIASLPSSDSNTSENASSDNSGGHTKTMLMLSGSRGVAGVSWTSEGVTSLEMLDLEEDEEYDVDDEEEEDEDEDLEEDE